MYVKKGGCVRKQSVKKHCRQEKSPYLCNVKRTKG